MVLGVAPQVTGTCSLLHPHDENSEEAGTYGGSCSELIPYRGLWTAVETLPCVLSCRSFLLWEAPVSLPICQSLKPMRPIFFQGVCPGEGIVPRIVSYLRFVHMCVLPQWVLGSPDNGCPSPMGLVRSRQWVSFPSGFGEVQISFTLKS